MNAQIEPPDQHSATDAYAARFSGAAGEWMLARQTDLLLGMLRDEQGAAVLDVGGGHGQITRPLAARGFRVRCLGSNEASLTQVAALVNDGRCEASTGDLLNLPFPSASFDVVTCFRILPHCPEWPRLIEELCRVARRKVVVDFPVRMSLNALTPFLYGIKKGVEGNTREYALFDLAEIAREFSRHNFGNMACKREFFWPMVAHRVIASPRLSATLELFPSLLGLTAFAGSPAIACFSRAQAERVSRPSAALVPEACS